MDSHLFLLLIAVAVAIVVADTTEAEAKKLCKIYHKMESVTAIE